MSQIKRELYLSGLPAKGQAEKSRKRKKMKRKLSREKVAAKCPNCASDRYLLSQRVERCGVTRRRKECEACGHVSPWRDAAKPKPKRKGKGEACST